ncbi:MAG: CAP domain-containing protein [Pseudomonadota bacterium]
MVMRLLMPALILTVAACMPISPGPQQQRPRLIAPTLLDAHNRERAAAGSPAMAWDSALAASAIAYADQLASEGRLRHSPRHLRPGVGENLWIGTRDAFAVETMVGSWTSERRLFRRGTFPHNSRTGRWSDVGHYTAIIWPSTRRVGCAIGQSARWDVLVCRYSPGGNVDGVAL